MIAPTIMPALSLFPEDWLDGAPRAVAVDLLVGEVREVSRLELAMPVPTAAALIWMLKVCDSLLESADELAMIVATVVLVSVLVGGVPRSCRAV